jgi:hypothetical protein
MKRRRVLKVVALAIAWSLAIVSSGLLIWGITHPAWYCRGGLAMGVNRGRVEIARSSGAISRAPIAWDIQGPQGYASILVGPVSMWRPSSSSAAIGTSPNSAPAPLFTLTVVYLPLWPWALLTIGVAGGLSWRWMRRVEPGHCGACGYDLRGLPAGRCPECGRAGMIARIVTAAKGRWTRRWTADLSPRSVVPSA